MLSLGIDQLSAGQNDVAFSTLRDGAEIARALGSAKLLAKFALNLASWLEFGGGDEAYVRANIAQALDGLGDDDVELRAMLIARRIATSYELPIVERIEQLDRAEQLIDGRSSPQVSLQLAFSRAMLRDPRRIAQTQAAVQRFRELADRYPEVRSDPQYVARRFFIELADYVCALTTCELGRADAAHARCDRIAREGQMLALDFLAELMRAGRMLGDARLDAVEASVQRLQEMHGMGGGFALAWVGCAIALADERGQLPVLAGALSSQALPVAQLPSSQRRNAAIMRAWLRAKGGKLNEVARVLAEVSAEELLESLANQGDLGMLCVLAECYDVLRDRAAAEALVAVLEPLAAFNAVGPILEYRGSVAHYVGMLSALLGRRETAAQHLELAEQVNAQLGMRAQLARTRALRERVIA